MARIDEEGESRGGMEMTGFQLPALARTGPAGMTELPIWNSRYGNVFLREQTWNRRENASQVACSSLCFSVKFCANVREKASAFHSELYVA